MLILPWIRNRRLMFLTVGVVELRCAEEEIEIVSPALLRKEDDPECPIHTGISVNAARTMPLLSFVAACYRALL